MTKAKVLPITALPQASKTDGKQADRENRPEYIELPTYLERNRLLGSAQSAALVGYSLAHWRRLYQTKKVPPPVRINGRKVGWPVGVLLDFMAARQTAA